MLANIGIILLIIFAILKIKSAFGSVEDVAPTTEEYISKTRIISLLVFKANKEVDGHIKVSKISEYIGLIINLAIVITISKVVGVFYFTIFTCLLVMVVIYNNYTNVDLLSRIGDCETEEDTYFIPLPKVGVSQSYRAISLLINILYYFTALIMLVIVLL